MKWLDIAWSRSARGFIAIGPNAFGVFSIGLMSVGIFSFGFISIGAFALCLGMAIGIVAGGVGSLVSAVSIFGTGVSLSSTDCLFFYGLCLQEVVMYIDFAPPVLFLVLFWYALRYRSKLWSQEGSNYDDIEAAFSFADDDTQLVDVAYILRNPGTSGRLVGNVLEVNKGSISIEVWEFEAWWKYSAVVDSQFLDEYREVLDTSVGGCLMKCRKTEVDDEEQAVSCCDALFPHVPNFSLVVDSVDALKKFPTTGEESSDDECKLVSSKWDGVLRCRSLQKLTRKQVQFIMSQSQSSPLKYRIARCLFGEYQLSITSFLFLFWESNTSVTSYLMWLFAVSFVVCVGLLAFSWYGTVISHLSMI